MNEPSSGPNGMDVPQSEFQILHRIFEDRLSTIEDRTAYPTATAAERTALISKFGELLRGLSALMKIREESGELASLDTVLTRLLGIISRAVSSDRSTLFLLDRETDELFSRVAEGDLGGEIRFPKNRGIAGQVFTTGESVIIQDAYADPRFNKMVDEQTGYVTRDILCVPVRSWDDQVIGVTEALNKLDGTFDQEDRVLLEALTSHAAAALESLQIHESMQRALYDEEQLLGISAALSSELKLDTLLERIMSITTDVLDADRSTLFLHDPRADELWSRVAEGLEVNEIRIPAGAGIAGSVFRSGEPINIRDAYADDRFNPEVDRATGYRTRSILCVPIVTNAGRIIGVAQVLNKNGGPFSPRDEQRLYALSSQAAIALENARLFEDVLNERNYSESILKSLSNGVVTLDSSRRIIKVNPAAKRILQTTGGRLLDEPAEAVFRDGNGWILESIDKVEDSRRMDLTLDGDIQLANGETAHVNLTIEPLIDVKEEPIGFLMIFEDITSERRVKSTMARYIDKELLDRVLEDDGSVLGGAAQNVTVMFSDIRDFTQLSEQLGPRDTVSVLNDYFSAMVEVVYDQDGILDKYIGDALMAVFGTPFPSPEDADNAVSAAEQMLSALRRINEGRALAGLAPIDVRIGINTGEVIAGNIGSEKRVEYTVIGDSVNVAARLEGVNRFYGTRVLVSDTTYRGLRRDRPLRELDLIRVKGRQAPVTIYEVMDVPGDGGARALSAALSRFAAGLRHYRNRDWAASITSFRNTLDADPGDGPARLFLNRSIRYLEAPPDPDWDGVWTLTEK